MNKIIKEETQKEIDSVKVKSNFYIKSYITVLKVLKSINNQIFYFCLSLFPALIVNYFIDVNLLLVLFAHFLMWYFYGKKLFNKKDLNEQCEEVSIVIEGLTEHLKTKKGVK